MTGEKITDCVREGVKDPVLRKRAGKNMSLMAVGVAFINAAWFLMTNGEYLLSSLLAVVGAGLLVVREFVKVE